MADDFTAMRVERDDIYPGGVGDSLEETNQFVYMYKSEEVPLVEFMYLVCTHMPRSYFRQLRSLLLCLSDIFWVLINSVVY